MMKPLAAESTALEVKPGSKPSTTRPIEPGLRTESAVLSDIAKATRLPDNRGHDASYS
jgi:hypothetical protein